MKAVVLRELGGPEKLRVEEVADPQPNAHEVLVRLKAAAINHRDVFIRQGKYAGIKLPIILGSDGAGEVVAVGAEVDPSFIGKAVVSNPSLDWGEDERVQGPAFRILGLPDNGTYSQFVKVPAANVHAKPSTLSFEEAAAIPLAGLTAYRAVATRAKVQAGETVLVTGIGGGVASFVLQIANHFGARVFVTSGSDTKLARAQALGAEGGANYRTGNWVKAIASLTGDNGVDVIIDSVGGKTFAQALEVIKPGGRIVTYGATTGAAKEIEVRRIFWKQLTILGSTMGTQLEFGAMLELFANSTLRPVVDHVFALDDVQSAHRRLEAAEHFGKIVMRIE
jgi:zinc-binding alcohol dehydrogenase/oxidoreductase